MSDTSRTDAEWRILIREAILSGNPLELAPARRKISVSNARNWSKARQIPAHLLREILLAHSADADPQGLVIVGGFIVGNLDIDLATISCRVAFVSCYFDSNISATDCSITELALLDCTLLGLELSWANIKSGLVLTKTRISKGITAKSVIVGGDVIIRNCTIENPHGYAATFASSRLGEAIIRHTDFKGEFYAAGMNVRRQFQIRDCLLQNRGGVALNLNGADIEVGLALQKCEITGSLQGTACKIAGQINFSDLKILGPEEDAAMMMQRMRVEGNLHIRNTSASGLIDLSSTKIEGQLSVRDLHLGNTQGRSLSLERISAARTITLDGIRADGTVSCAGATAGSVFQISDVDGHDSTTMSLILDRVTSAGTFSVRDVRVSDRLLARGCNVGGQMTIRRIRFSSPEKNEFALTGSSVSEELFIEDFHLNGRLDLARAVVVRQTIIRTKPGRHSPIFVNMNHSRLSSLVTGHPDHAPVHISALGTQIDSLDVVSPGQVALRGATGWTIRGIVGPLLASRTETTKLLDSIPQRGPFVGQPWIAIANALAVSGEPAHARFLRYQASVRVAKNSFWLARLFIHTPHRLVVGYGYYPLLAAIWLLALFVCTWITVGVTETYFEPSDWRAWSDVSKVVSGSLVVTSEISERYPEFSPFLYTIDTVIPAANTGQANAWRIAGNHPLALLFSSVRAASWVLTALLLAGMTGLLKKG